MSARYEVAIAGGGPVGLALALALARLGYEVALIEPQPRPALDAAPDDYDLRTYALSNASVALLTRLAAWPAVAGARAAPYAAMRVWEDAPERALGFDAKLVGEAVLGHIVEDRVLRAALFERVVQEPRIAVLASRVEAFERGEPVAAAHAGEVGAARLVESRAATLRLADGAVLRVKLAVAADGAGSTLRELGGLAMTGEPAAQRAIVANVRVERAHESTAWQRFTADGPLAFLPLGGRNCGVVWSVPQVRAAELLALDDDAFRAVLGEAFQWRLGAVETTSPRASFPLLPQLASRYVGARLALVGDAAHTVLPLAGQGLNLGLLDVAALAEVLEAETAGGSRLARADAVSRAAVADPGDATLLARYERARASDNALAASTFRALDRLFRSRTPGAAWLRRSGLSLVDQVLPLKRELALVASGFAGRVPPLARRLS